MHPNCDCPRISFELKEDEQFLSLAEIVRTYKSIAKIENGKLNIYNKENDGYKHAKLIEEFGEDYGSIEAQIVNISDEIAQCSHDLQDIWMAKIISEKEIQDIYDYSSEFLGKKQEATNKLFQKLLKN